MYGGGRIFDALKLLFVVGNALAERRASEAGIPRRGENTGHGYFWHVTDVFFDPAYLPSAAPEHDCRMKSATDSTGNCGFFGELGQCSAFGLMETIARAMNATARWENVAPDFCIFTGNLRCPNARDSRDAIHETMSAFVTDVRNAGFLDVYPAYGWYDYRPHGHHPLERGTIYGRSKNSPQDGAGSSIFHEPSPLRTGYFSRTQPPRHRIRIIAMNTNFYAKNHVASRLSDPAGQWSWLVAQLRECRTVGQKAFVVMSGPPGVDRLAYDRREGSRYDDRPVWSERHNQRYLRIINNYQDTIAAQFGGQRHEDSFRLVYNGQGKVVSAILLAPATTPRFHSYPAMRIYMYDGYTGKLIDFVQYSFDLTKANSEADTRRPEKYWKVGYSFRDFHRLPDATTTSLEQLVENLRENDASFQRYRDNVKGFEDRKYTCDYRCRLITLCEMSSLDSGSFFECLSGEFAAHERRVRKSWLPSKALRNQLIGHIFSPNFASVAPGPTSSGNPVAVILFGTASLKLLFGPVGS